MTTKATVWMEHFRVRSYETDPGGTASLHAICNFLQEAAGNHAAELGVSIEHLSGDEELARARTVCLPQ